VERRRGTEVVQAEHRVVENRANCSRSDATSVWKPQGSNDATAQVCSRKPKPRQPSKKRNTKQIAQEFIQKKIEAGVADSRLTPKSLNYDVGIRRGKIALRGM